MLPLGAGPVGDPSALQSGRPQRFALPRLSQKPCLYLAHYPFVVVRITCRVCSRGRVISACSISCQMRDLTDSFSYDCLWRTESTCPTSNSRGRQTRLPNGEAAPRQKRIRKGLLTQRYNFSPVLRKAAEREELKMPIRRYGEGVFSSEALSLMGKAFEAAIWTLGLQCDETKTRGGCRVHCPVGAE
jgi:hypothetical protein